MEQDSRKDLLISAVALGVLAAAALIGSFYTFGFAADIASGAMADGSESRAVARASTRFSAYSITLGSLLALVGVTLAAGFFWTIRSIVARPTSTDPD